MRKSADYRYYAQLFSIGLRMSNQTAKAKSYELNFLRVIISLDPFPIVLYFSFYEFLQLQT